MWSELVFLPVSFVVILLVSCVCVCVCVCVWVCVCVCVCVFECVRAGGEEGRERELHIYAVYKSIYAVYKSIYLSIYLSIESI
jgi:hypothetical protein